MSEKLTPEETQPQLQEEKAALRRTVLAQRDLLSAPERERRSAALTRHFLALPELRRASVVMCFVAFRSEVLTEPIIAQCLAQGKTVVAPRIMGRHHMEAFPVTDLARDLEPSVYGLREPRPDGQPVPPTVIDLVVVPGSVFDRTGHRIGYGGGYYDAYSERLRAGAARVGLAFDLQLVDTVPSEPHDLRLDALVTESGVLRFATRSELPSPVSH